MPFVSLGRGRHLLCPFHRTVPLLQFAFIPLRSCFCFLSVRQHFSFYLMFGQLLSFYKAYLIPLRLLICPLVSSVRLFLILNESTKQTLSNIHSSLLENIL